MHEMGDDVPRFETWDEVADAIYEAFDADLLSDEDEVTVANYPNWGSVRDAVDSRSEWANGLGVAEDGEPDDWLDKTTESLRDLFERKIERIRAKAQRFGWDDWIEWADNFWR